MMERQKRSRGCSNWRGSGERTREDGRRLGVPCSGDLAQIGIAPRIPPERETDFSLFSLNPPPTPRRIYLGNKVNSCTLRIRIFRILPKIITVTFECNDKGMFRLNEGLSWKESRGSSHRKRVRQFLPIVPPTQAQAAYAKGRGPKPPSLSILKTS